MRLLPLLAVLAVGLFSIGGCAAPSSASLAAAQLLPLGDGIAGRILFVKDGNIWIWTEGRARQLTSGDTWRQPQWSPDGSEIAYVYRSTNFSEIFVMSADGSNSRRLTRSQSSSLSDNDWVFHPTWAPGGTQIAYVSDSDTYNPVVWLMNKDGSGKHQLQPVSSLQEAADGLSWSPDGRRLAVAAFSADQSQLVLLDVARGLAQPLTEGGRGALDPAWSPDGQVVAYAARNGARMDIRLRRLDGGPEVEVTNTGFARSPAWSPDGHRLAFVSSRSGSFEIYVVEVSADGGGGALAVKNERQLTKDLALDAPSGLSWGN